MVRRVTLTALVVVLMLGATLPFASSAGATSEYITGNVERYTVVEYYVGRTVTAAGSNIYFQKFDGPGLYLQWYKCGDYSGAVGKIGPWRYFVNPDPTDRQYLDGGFIYGARFCLRSYSMGSNTYDTFSGWLDYNVYW